ncbi:hypothetical protein [Lactobacillus porci]|nr:hypothetical protein [Lactobacillus porci]
MLGTNRRTVRGTTQFQPAPGADRTLTGDNGAAAVQLLIAHTK